MFTGLIEEKGRLRSVQPAASDSAVLTVYAQRVLTDVELGDSIAVNGVCLTVVEATESSFRADVMAETLSRSSLGDLQSGSEVNLERAARADSRLGGHIVQGHVDGVGRLEALEESDRWTTLTFSLPRDLAGFVAEKGSIAVDGVSLTVVSVSDTEFQVSLIPTTLAETTLGNCRVGDRVNLEVDVIAKYVDRLLRVGRP